MMPGVNCVIYGCSSVKLTPGVSLYRSLTLEENIPDPEPAIINILYVWSGIYEHLWLCSILFSFVTSSEWIILHLVSLIYILFKHLHYMDMM